MFRPTTATCSRARSSAAVNQRPSAIRAWNIVFEWRAQTTPSSPRSTTFASKMGSTAATPGIHRMIAAPPS
jgi:hypothetical protein